MIGGRHSVCGVPRTVAHTSAHPETERCVVCWDIYTSKQSQLGRWRAASIR